VNTPPRLADWKSIRRSVLNAIQSGELKPGDYLPREVELAEKYGCTRSTVGRALRDLATAGFLERKRKGGTTVSANPVRKAPLEVPIIRAAIRASGKTPDYRLVQFDRSANAPQIAGVLGLAPDTAFVLIEAVYLADNVPFQFERRWLASAAVPKLQEGSIQSAPVDEWLLENAPLTRASIEIQAVAAPALVAEHLNVETGAPSLLVTRASWSQVQPIGVLHLYHGPDGKLRSSI
jgi:GntR family histidine utilization transcriptional repressor